MLKPLFQSAALAAALALSGCVSFTVTGPLGVPSHKAAAEVPRAARIADVVISAPDINDTNRQAISRALTQQLNRYVQAGGYFQQLSQFPTPLAPQDVVLKFEMTSLKGHRGPHPAYFPGALLTLTIWIWVNGPVDVDRYDIAGHLVIENRDGTVLARTQDEVKFERNVGIYDGEYWAPSMGAPQLQELIAKLLDTATAQLPAITAAATPTAATAQGTAQ